MLGADRAESLLLPAALSIPLPQNKTPQLNAKATTRTENNHPKSPDLHTHPKQSPLAFLCRALPLTEIIQN